MRTVLLWFNFSMYPITSITPVHGGNHHQRGPLLKSANRKIWFSINQILEVLNSLHEGKQNCMSSSKLVELILWNCLKEFCSDSSSEGAVASVYLVVIFSTKMAIFVTRASCPLVVMVAERKSGHAELNYPEGHALLLSTFPSIWISLKINLN